jgi:hypothetical protein
MPYKIRDADGSARIDKLSLWMPLLRMILSISSTPVLQYTSTIENDSHSHQEK